MRALVKTQVENGISELFDFRGQTIDASDKSVFILKYLGLNDEKGKKNNLSYPLTEGQGRSGSFFWFMMAIYPY